MSIVRAQGSIEYLVVLGTVMTISLVSVVLLSSQLESGQEKRFTQSESYWKSIYPISIIDSYAWNWLGLNASSPTCIKFRNNGPYPIRIHRIVADNRTVSQGWQESHWADIDIYLTPGETKSLTCPDSLFGISFCRPGTVVPWMPNNTVPNEWLCVAKTICRPTRDEQGYGYVEVTGFGFDYTQYIEGKEIENRQVNKLPLMVRCIEPA